MANRIEFSARVDQLRKLKAGANPSLLETWTSLVFQAWQWDEVSQDALDRLAAHPYLPRDGLSQAAWPSLVLRDIQAVKAGVAAGLDPRNIKPALNHRSVRASAVFENASMEVHDLLDGAGVPDLTMREAEKLIPSSLHKHNDQAFEYLAKRYWHMIEMAMTPPESSTLLARVFREYHSETSGPSANLKSSFSAWFTGHVLKTLMSRGVDWAPAAPLVLNGSSQGKTVARLMQMRAELTQEKMDRELPPPSPSALRPRGRF